MCPERVSQHLFLTTFLVFCVLVPTRSSTAFGSVGVLDAPFRCFPVGYLSRSPRVADLNTDGHLDVICVNTGVNGLGGSVSVLMGNGDGTLQPKVDYEVTSPRDAALVHVNSDGWLDLVVCGYEGGSGYLVILWGLPDGSFVGRIKTLFTGYPWSMDCGDLTGDGHTDVAIASTADAGAWLRIYPGHGDGTFGPPGSYPGPYAHDLEICDLNNDGRPDVIESGVLPDGVIVRLNLGAGALGHATGWTAGRTPNGLLLQDVTEDGVIDITVASSETYIDSGIWILPGIGDGTFQEAIFLPDPADLNGVTSGDFDGDGVIDLVAICHCNQISWFKGRGGGAFDASKKFITLDSPTGIEAADFNHDGRPDIVVSGRNSAAVAIHASLPDSAFGPWERIPAGHGPHGLAAADFNLDQMIDLAIPNLQSSSFSILLGRPSGTFDLPLSATISAGPWAADAADFDGDGFPDLAIAQLSGKRVTLMKGLGDGTFSVFLDLPLEDRPMAVLLKDLSADGRIDLVVGLESATIQPNRLLVYRATEFGDFEPWEEQELPDRPIGGFLALDLNQDSRLDLITATNADSVVVLYGLEDGHLGDRRTFWSDASGYDLASGDFNSDGNPDLVVPRASWYGGVSILMSAGDGTFGPPHFIATGIDPTGVAVHDIDYDGALDVLIAHSGTNSVGILKGNDLDGFLPVEFYGTGMEPWSLLVLDIDDDLRPEVLTADAHSSTVTILSDQVDSPTPVFLNSFHARLSTHTTVELNWETSSQRQESDFRIMAASQADEWDVEPRALDGFRFTAVDQLAHRKISSVVSYRLLLKTGTGEWFSLAEQDVHVADSAPKLLGPVPNPLVSDTRLSFELAFPQRAVLSVLDIQGRTVIQLLNSLAPEGRTEVYWDGRDARGVPVASGVYAVHLETAQGMADTRLVVIGRR